MNTNHRIALVTVSSENYVQWSMVMIYSFLKSNPWFKGDLVIIGDDLSDQSIANLNIFPGIIIEKPSVLLNEKLEQLCSDLPDFKSRIARFYSLEVFRLHDYDRILFLDSDMIVIKDVSELFQLPANLYASLEWFSGKGRRISDFEISDPACIPGDFIEQPVNSGFLMMSRNFTHPDMYQSLVDSIGSSHWINSKTQLTDQLIINKFFNHRFCILDARYNYRPKNAAGIFRKEKVTFEDASIIHFILKAKPWNFNEALKPNTLKLEMIKAYELWYVWYFDFLGYLHLTQKIKFARCFQT